MWCVADACASNCVIRKQSFICTKHIQYLAKQWAELVNQKKSTRNTKGLITQKHEALTNRTETNSEHILILIVSSFNFFYFILMSHTFPAQDSILYTTSISPLILCTCAEVLVHLLSGNAVRENQSGNVTLQQFLQRHVQQQSTDS